MEALSIVHNSFIKLEIYYRTHKQNLSASIPKETYTFTWGHKKNKIRPIIFWLG
jgi:hypothetical protein